MIPFDLVDNPLDAAQHYIATHPDSSNANSLLKLILALTDENREFAFRHLLGMEGHYLQLGLSLIHARCYARYHDSDWFGAAEWCLGERARWRSA